MLPSYAKCLLFGTFLIMATHFQVWVMVFDGQWRHEVRLDMERNAVVFDLIESALHKEMLKIPPGRVNV